MLERILSCTLKRRAAVLFITAVLAAAGLYSLTQLPVDAFPDVTNNQVEIVSHADGLSALEIERFVTLPVETAMRGLPGVREMRSVTKFGLSIVTLVFDDDVDVYFARQLVSERIAEARVNIPEHVNISMGPVATVMGEIYQYTLDGEIPADSATKIKYLTELRSLQEWVVTPLLKNIPGVNEINSFGGYFRQVQVIVSPERMAKFGVTIDEVERAVRSNNRNTGGNILEKDAGQAIIRSIGLIASVGDIENIVLRASGGTPVLLKHVADILNGEAVRQGAALKNGTEECVGGIVMMLRGENSREVVNRVKEKADEINESSLLPDGIKIVPYYDRSHIVNASVGTVGRALLEGAVLVMIVLYLFLMSFRGSAVVLIALPLSLLITFMIMKLTGLSANLMSLGGLAISIGMIIDATIIQVENVQRHLSDKGHAQAPLSSVLKAVIEVRNPSLFGELIIAMTFIPILSLEGIEGKMFAPLAYTVIIALLASLLLSVFVIPVICSIFLRPGNDNENKIMNGIRKAYLPVLEFSIKRKKSTLTAAGFLLLIALLIIPGLGTEFIPVMDEDAFDMDIQLLPGTSLSKAIEVNRLAGEKLSRFGELDVTVARIGQTGVALDARGVEKTGYVGVLKPKADRHENQSREELAEAMRRALSSIPGISFGFSQPIQCRIDEIVAGTRAQLIVRLFGDNLTLLKNKADEIGRILASVEGVTDLNIEKISGQPYMNISIDRRRIARYGLNIDDVQNVIDLAVAGMPVSSYYEESRNYDIIIRLPEEHRNSAEAIGNILVSAPGGMSLPIAQLADIEMTEGPLQISREDGLRRIGIEMNVQGRDIGSVVAEAKQRIRENVTLPGGYMITWGGQFENQQRAMRKLAVIGPAVIAGIFLLLFISFRSVRPALLVMLNLPFALIGGVISLYLSGMYLSVPASVGFIVLFGVAVLNGVVLVSKIIQLRDEGVPVSEAVKLGCLNRLRPVLMTATITVFSLIPMLFASGTGSEIQKPLASVVVGGLITSTLLTLVLIPTMYERFERKREHKNGFNPGEGSCIN